MPSDHTAHTDRGRQLLVFADRDAAEEAAEDLAVQLPELGDVELVRDSLAGEDDAEDAQWLLVVEAPEDAGWTAELLAALDKLADEYDGWREQE